MPPMRDRSRDTHGPVLYVTCSMRALLLLVVIIGANGLGRCQGTIADPSGEYFMDRGGFELERGVSIGHSGSVEVKLIDKEHVSIMLDANRGWPSYNLGHIEEDTFLYDGRTAVYRYEDDSTCVITFTFMEQALEVRQVQGDINWGCGFGMGVVVDGTYHKAIEGTPMPHWWDGMTVDCGDALKGLPGSWTREEMDRLVNSFHPACLNNVEYREWSNELYFAALAKDPALFIAALDDAVEFWQIPVVLDALSAPINDSIDPNAIKEKVIASEVQNEWLKNWVIRALNSDFY
jgi:hypothetical protein